MTIKKFYSNNFAPNTARVNLMLKLKGIELDTVEIDLMKREQLSTDFKEISPEGTVPALVLNNGIVLTDVIAILYYIENSYPETQNLLGKSTIEQSQILGMIHQIYFGGLMGVAEILRNGFMSGFEDRGLPGNIPIKQIPELMDRGRTRLSYFYDQTNKKLENKPFLVGDNISQADIDLYVLCNFSGFVKESFDPKKVPHIAKHFSKIDQIIKS